MTRTAELALTQRRIRLIQLLESLERAALAPVETEKLHAFAYLADVLSPVYSLAPFDKRIIKSGRSPYYPDLQRQLDALVAMGLVEASGLAYKRAGDGAMTFYARYALRFGSSYGAKIREALERDPIARETQHYLDELARALATLRDDDIAAAASEDASYEDPNVSSGDVISFDNVLTPTKTIRATDSLDKVFPDVGLTPSRRIFMYANYLGRRVHVAS